jgi:hypothetical protein
LRGEQWLPKPPFVKREAAEDVLMVTPLDRLAQKRVVLRIAALFHALGNRHQFGGGEHRPQVVEEKRRDLGRNARPP